MKTISKTIKFEDSLELECGTVLPSFELIFETYGELNKDKSNAVLVCHAFSGNHHAAGESDLDSSIGWWDQMIGPNKAIDTIDLTPLNSPPLSSKLSHPPPPMSPTYNNYPSRTV